MKNKKIYDFHTHIADLETIEKYYESNVIPVINCQNADEFKKINKMFETIKNNRSFEEIRPFMSIGIHPHDSWKYEKDISDVYEEIIKKVPLVGEVGMDGCWCDVSFDIQEKVFRESLNLAKKYNKAVILHTKSMEKRIYEIIKDYDLDFIVHWYSCKDYIKEFIDKGCYFTVGPAILIDENIRSLVKRAPIDRLLLETDGIEALEWLFKKDYRAEYIRRSLEVVCEEISLLKNMSKEEMFQNLQKNSERLLKI